MNKSSLSLLFIIVFDVSFFSSNLSIKNFSSLFSLLFDSIESVSYSLSLLRLLLFGVFVDKSINISSVFSFVKFLSNLSLKISLLNSFILFDSSFILSSINIIFVESNIISSCPIESFQTSAILLFSLDLDRIYK